jgi:hypothetical protein
MDPESAVLWFAGKALQGDKKLADHMGRSDRTKAVVKLQKKGQGAPAREPVGAALAGVLAMATRVARVRVLVHAAPAGARRACWRRARPRRGPARRCMTVGSSAGGGRRHAEGHDGVLLQEAGGAKGGLRAAQGAPLFRRLRGTFGTFAIWHRAGLWYRSLYRRQPRLEETSRRHNKCRLPPQRLAESSDDSYNSSSWANPGTLKQQFTGLGSIRVPR